MTRWETDGGAARSPWLDGGPSGAPGRPAKVLALLLHETRAKGELDGGRYERIGTAAGHSLVRLTLKTTINRALAQLKARGHGLVGRDARTNAFFAEKAGLARPFLHVEQDADGKRAPLHGDLVEALAALGSTWRA